MSLPPDAIINGEITALFDEVAAAFGALDLARFLRCYRLPSLAVTADRIGVLDTDEAFASYFQPAMDRLRALGFARSVHAGMRIHRQGSRLALASMRWTRYRADGGEIEQLGATYSVHHDTDGWKIVMLTAHAIDGVLPTAS